MLKCNKLHLVISKEKLRMKYARSKSYWMSREILLLCLKYLGDLILKTFVFKYIIQFLSYPMRNTTE